MSYIVPKEKLKMAKGGFLNITVRDIVFGTRHCFWDSGYLCHFSTEMAEIWCPGTSFQDDWTYKFSALYLLYFQSYETFS